MNTSTAFKSLTNKLLSGQTMRFLNRAAAPETGYPYAQPPRDATTPDSEPFAFWTHRDQLVVVRRATHEDTGRIGEMLRQLSDRTRELRYLMPRPLTSEWVQQEAHRIAHGHTRDHVTLIAEAQDHGADVVVAVAELVRDAQRPTVGEFALVVRDDMQGQAIGSLLLRRLTRIAPALGIATLRADVLPENRAMQALVRKLGMPYITAFQRGNLEIVVRLPLAGI